MIAKDPHRRLILDRTNVTRADRICFLRLAFEPKGAVLVHFTAPPEACAERVAQRTEHPSIGYGKGRNVVRSMREQLELPSLSEGFEEIISIETFKDRCEMM